MFECCKPLSGVWVVFLSKHSIQRSGTAELPWRGWVLECNASRTLHRREHLLIKENSRSHVEWCWPTRKFEGGEFSGQLLHCKCHLVTLPLQPILARIMTLHQWFERMQTLDILSFSRVLNAKLCKEVHHVRISSEENMKAGLYPIAIFILPCRDLHWSCVLHAGDRWSGDSCKAITETIHTPKKTRTCTVGLYNQLHCYASSPRSAFNL